MNSKILATVLVAIALLAFIVAIVITSYNPWGALAASVAVALVLLVNLQNSFTHTGSVWHYFSHELNESKVILLVLALFSSYMFFELRSIDLARQSNNTELLQKLDFDKRKVTESLDNIEAKLITTANGRLATESKDITDAFVATCETASKKIRAAYVVSSSPTSSKYLTDKIIKFMKARDKVVYEVVFIVDESVIGDKDAKQLDAVIEEEWLKKFRDERLEERFTLKVMQSRTPPNLDVIIADDQDVYLSFFNRPLSKLNKDPYNSDQVIVYRAQSRIAPYFNEWFNKNYWERALIFKDWQYKRILRN